MAHSNILAPTHRIHGMIEWLWYNGYAKLSTPCLPISFTNCYDITMLILIMQRAYQCGSPTSVVPVCACDYVDSHWLFNVWRVGARQEAPYLPNAPSMVRSVGLEPTCLVDNRYNLSRLPIPPRPQYYYTFSKTIMQPLLLCSFPNSYPTFAF